MKQNSKKNVTGKLFGKNILSIVAFACLFTIAFTSCEEDKNEQVDLSKITIGDIDYEFPQVYCPPRDSSFNYIEYQFYGNAVKVQVYTFRLYVRDVFFKTITTTNTVVGDTVKINIRPDENIEPALSYAIMSMNFSCTIKNVPSCFYVEFSTHHDKVVKKIVRKPWE